MTKTSTREQWLQKFTQAVRPWYLGELPETLHLSTGFPSNGCRSNTIGECWNALASDAHAPHIFVHPKLTTSTEVAAVLVHELVHAARPDAKHGAGFRKLATEIGLVGKMTCTTASPELVAKIAKVVDKIGPYPHPVFSVGGGTSRKPTQTTRMIKCECDECGYTVRTTQKWLDLSGPPVCPACMDTLSVA